MIALIQRVIDRIAREPVLGLGAAGLSITAWAPTWVDTDAKKAAMAGILLWLQRTFSTSKKTADENVESAKYIGAVEHQNVANAAKMIAAADVQPTPVVVEPVPDELPATTTAV